MSDAQKETVIEVRNLTNAFGPHVVHQNLNLDVYRGEVLGLVGGSGTGKSVLMNTILGLRKPQAGSINVLGHDTQSPSARRGLESRWGVLFQNGALFSSLTVKENVLLPLREHTRLPEKLMSELADMKINLAGLEAEAGAKKPSELSGGMLKRAALARALALDPELLFFDEPTSGLDPISAAAFDDLVVDLQSTLDLTVFMVTHDLDSLYAICDRIAVLADKKVEIVAPIEEVLQSDHPWIRSYFHGKRSRAAGMGQENT
ncbi:MAG: ABC transporter ATP-binding protein [Robiginitomaculum sp.]|nr:MAG: ABC transporter ATP-binding protein [Robiginitomaculum sp.]